MALTSASTLTNAFDQYKDNLSWEGSTTSARAALEAIRFILMSRPSAQELDGHKYTYESLLEEKKALEDYLKTYDTTNRPRSTFVRGRMLT